MFHETDTFLPFLNQALVNVRNLEQQQFIQEDDEINQDDDAAMLIVALAHLGGKPSRKICPYLTRPDLTPCHDSAWAYMYSAQNNRAFITTLGLDLKTFEELSGRFNSYWNNEVVHQDDVNPHGEPQPWRRLLDGSGCLGLVLHWLNSTMAEFSLHQIFGVTPSVCSRYLINGLSHLLQVLRKHPQAQITWPNSETLEMYSSMIEAKFPLLKKCFGFVDGLNLPIQAPGDDELVFIFIFFLLFYTSCL